MRRLESGSKIWCSQDDPGSHRVECPMSPSFDEEDALCVAQEELAQPRLECILRASSGKSSLGTASDSIAWSSSSSTIAS